MCVRVCVCLYSYICVLDKLLFSVKLKVSNVIVFVCVYVCVYVFYSLSVHMCIVWQAGEKEKEEERRKLFNPQVI